MASKIKKLFVVGSMVTGLFMAITACGDHTSSQNPASSNEQGSSSSLNISSEQSNNSSSENESSSAASSSSSQAPVVLVSITAVSDKDAFEYGEELSVKLYANYSDGSSVEVTNYQVSGYNPNLSGEQTVVFTYEGMTTSLKVKVNDPVLVSINVVNNSESYDWGEDLDISVTATYSDGSTVTVTDYTVDGYNSQEEGEQNVTVSYQGKSTSIKVKVNKPVLIDISVTSSKESYEWGEDLDLTVIASYSNNSTSEVTDYKVEGYNKEQPGEQEVTVTYEGKTYTFKVTVNNPVLVSITAVSNKDAYEYGEDLDLTVIGTYSDGSTVIFDSYSVSGYNNTVPGAQEVTVTVEGKTCTLGVSVKELTNKFPAESLKAYLQVEDIKVSIPSPVGYESWTEAVELEQDASKYFIATTNDKGTVGTDSIADTYALTLNTNGWKVSKDDRGVYSATKDQVNVLVTFRTFNKVFSMRVEGYEEFPSKAYRGYLIAEKSSLSTGDTIILGNIEQEIVITSLENDAFNSIYTQYGDEGPNVVSKSAVRLTLAKNSSGNWTFTDVKGNKLGATAVGKLAWNEGSTGWTVTFNSKKGAIIMNEDKSMGRLGFDPATGTMTTTKNVIGTSLVYPQVFKLVETTLIYPTSISLSGRQQIGLNKSARLTIDYVPANANSLSDVTWTSSNENVITVTNGTIKGVGIGQATITAKTKSKNNYLETSYNVEVKESVLNNWTIMIYLCGADLESGSGLATADIKEILKVNNQPDDVNIIIETGGSRSWHGYGISASNLTRFHVENKSLVEDEKLPKANMGKQSTFESFLDWGLTEYPADKTGVVFWNHGGALSGVCFDENYGGDGLTNSETSAAFKNVFNAHGVDKLEFVGYDACIMQIQDVAEFNSKYFEYMIGSEESEAGEGWVYDQWIDDVYADRDTDTILKATCDSFVNKYGSDQTLSYLNLNKMPTFFNAIESMSSAIKSTVTSNKSSFNSIINNSKRFSGSQVDGYDFLNRLGSNSKFSSFSDKISEVKTAYKNLVVYSRKGGSAGNANGLGFIYASSYSYPASETSFMNWRSLFN